MEYENSAVLSLCIVLGFELRDFCTWILVIVPFFSLKLNWVYLYIHFFFFFGCNHVLLLELKQKKRNMFVKPVVKKKQTSVDHITGNKIPKSFVFSRGKLPGPLRQLQMDLRKLMLPHTALNLKVKRYFFSTLLLCFLKLLLYKFKIAFFYSLLVCFVMALKGKNGCFSCTPMFHIWGNGWKVDLVSWQSLVSTPHCIIWKCLILMWFFYICWANQFASFFLLFGCRRRNGIISKTFWMLLGLWVLHISLYCQRLKLLPIWGLQGLRKAQRSHLRYLSIHWHLMLLNLSCDLDVHRIFSKTLPW